jgi:hypothetical protein
MLARHLARVPVRSNIPDSIYFTFDHGHLTFLTSSHTVYKNPLFVPPYLSLYLRRLRSVISRLVS